MAVSHVAHDQAEVIEFLGAPSTYGLNEDVVRVDTHGAAVFLAGKDAYKIKRAVRFPFMDFSTLEKRRQACESEVRVNHANAPDIYLGVLPIVRQAGSLALGGPGEVVEWAVHMRRFDERQTCDHVADQGGLTLALTERLADAIVQSQVRAQERGGTDSAGDLRAIIDGNQGSLDETPDLFEPTRVSSLTKDSRRVLERVAPLLAGRSKAGFVRRCHGDLHLRNLVLRGETPTLFDALEFDESLATIDVLYDFAFLLMDLLERGLALQANHLFNRYLVAWRDERQLAGLAALPLFISVRAAIRAKVIAAGLAHLTESRRPTATATAQRYFELAESALVPVAPCLVAIGGLSGTGKSTLAAHLAPLLGCVPGAVHLRSDVERKQLSGVGEYERLPPEAYDRHSSDVVYGILRHKADVTIRSGYSVIVDAVHLHSGERDAVRELAVRLNAGFVGLWLEAPLPELVSRVGRRVHDASDARAETVGWQAERGTGAIDWQRIDAGADPARVLSCAQEIIRRG